MAIEIVQQDHVGLVIAYQVQESDGSGMDISDATNTKLITRSPVTLATEIHEAVFLEDAGTEGWLAYTTVAGDLFESGSPWQVQVYVVRPSTTFLTELDTFKVNANLVDIDDEGLA